MALDSRTLNTLLLPPRFAGSVIGGTMAAVVLDIFSCLFPYYLPYLPLGLLLVTGGIYTAICLGGAAKLPAGMPLGPFPYCGACKGMRIGLLALFFFAIMIVISDGKGVTQLFADQIEIQRQERQAFEEQNGPIIPQALPEKITENPQAPIDYYNNALLYYTRMNETRKAFESLDTLYKNFTPNKLDGAILYDEIGRLLYGEAGFYDILKERIQNRGDVMLLAMAAHYADVQGRQNIRAKIRDMDPRNPLGYWDTAELPDVVAMAIPRNVGQARDLQLISDNIVEYRNLVRRADAGRYFFIPQARTRYAVLATQAYRDTYNKIRFYTRSRYR